MTKHEETRLHFENGEKLTVEDYKIISLAIDGIYQHGRDVIENIKVEESVLHLYIKHELLAIDCLQQKDTKDTIAQMLNFDKKIIHDPTLILRDGDNPEYVVFGNVVTMDGNEERPITNIIINPVMYSTVIVHATGYGDVLILKRNGSLFDTVRI